MYVGAKCMSWPSPTGDNVVIWHQGQLVGLQQGLM